MPDGFVATHEDIHKEVPEDTFQGNFRQPPPKHTNILLIIICIFLIVVVVFFAYIFGSRSKRPVKQYVLPSTPEVVVPSEILVASPSPVVGASNAVGVVISSPQSNELVKSPLTITGTVPAGWMFEGQFPIKLLDANKNLIVQGIGKEVVPGSWSSGSPISFNASISFSTTATNGFIQITKDNPSGLPQNDASFEIPVMFR